MRKSVRRVTWVTPAVKALLQSFADSEKRLVRTAGELQLVLLESLRAYQESLKGSPPSQELWNAVGPGRGAIRDPKDENNFSTCLKLHFDRDLRNRAIISDREVQIRPGMGPDRAQLTDLLVTAVPFNAEGAAGTPVSVVVEVKGAWNDGVLTDMDAQLCKRYLQGDQHNFGIYVVGYFTCQAWNRLEDGRRKSGASNMDILVLEARLREQAKSLSSQQRRVEAVVLDARLTA
jgi:hypothetical protein